MNLRIIEANISHAAAIATVGKKAFRQAFGSLFNNQDELFQYLEKTYDPIKLTKSLKKGNNVYFIALLDEQVVGFAKVKINSLNENIESIAQMELQKLYVLPEHHGKKIGSALLNEVKKLASYISPDHIWLDTHIANEKAIHLYEKNGFRKIGKKFFTIGTQTFEYHVMGLAVSEMISVL